MTGIYERPIHAGTGLSEDIAATKPPALPGDTTGGHGLPRSIRAWAQSLIAAGGSDVPAYGSARWQALAPDSPARVAACVMVAERSRARSRLGAQSEVRRPRGLDEASPPRPGDYLGGPIPWETSGEGKGARDRTPPQRDTNCRSAIRIDVGKRSAWLRGEGIARYLDEIGVPRMRDWHPERKGILMCPVDRVDELLTLLEYRDRRIVHLMAVDQ